MTYKPRHLVIHSTAILIFVVAFRWAPVPTAALAQTQSAKTEHGQKEEQRFRRAAELAGQALADLEDGRCTVARDRLLEVDRLLPDNLLPKINLAICHSILDQRDQALQWLEQARRIAPDNPQALFATARVLEPLLLDDAGARRLWDQTLTRFERTRPKDPRPPYLRGTAAENSGDADAFAQADGYYQRALRNSPENLAIMLAGLNAAARSGNSDNTADALDTIEDRLNGFDQRAQRFADQLRDALASDNVEALRPPALILLNLLRPTDLYRVGLTELLGRGDGIQLFPQLDFDPPLPPSVQGGQDIALTWTNQTIQWAGKANDAFVWPDGEPDTLWLPDNRLLRAAKGAPIRVPIVGLQTAGDAPFSRLGADLNQDGLADLIQLASTGALTIQHQSSASATTGAPQSLRFEPATEIKLPKTHRLIAGDVDQEGDIDLLALSLDSQLIFLQNRGSDGLVATPLAIEINQAKATDAELVDLDDDGDLDLVLATSVGVMVFDNLRGGRYRDVSQQWFPQSTAGTELLIADFNNDGRFDVLIFGASATALFHNTGSTYRASPLPDTGGVPWAAAVAADFDNDGDVDLAMSGRYVAAGGTGTNVARGIQLLRNRRDQFTVEPLDATAREARTLIAADLDADGDLDLWTSYGVLRNDGGNTNHWLRVRLQGLSENNSKNNILGIGAKVEIRAGGAYQTKLSSGTVQHFGLGSQRRAEVLRVLWTNGLAQTQQQVSSRQTLLEKQVLKGSCPFLYTWTGDGFEFHTDLLWRSTLGMTFSDGSAAPHQSGMDWVLIPGDRLVQNDGKYWLNTTAELWETIYIDQQELLVVDHPQQATLVIDESFRPPPHPTTPPLHWLTTERTPVTAVDHLGESVLAELAQRDELRVVDLPLTRYQGATEEHAIDLVFETLPASGSRTLLLWGWIFPTDTSINIALAQDPALSTAPPRLDIFGADGWRVLIPSLGLPMGKRKAMVVELDHLLTDAERTSGSLRLRVVSTMQIYWNKASLSLSEHPKTDNTDNTDNTDKTQTPYRITRLSPSLADLHYRGFSAQLPRAPGAPHLFDYSQVDTSTRFRDLEGDYTPYGDTLQRVSSTDGSLVIMNAGDELSFAYEAHQLPPLPEGWTRDFVLFTDGWVKDADIHTKFSQTVEPVPFHGMPGYTDGARKARPEQTVTRRINATAFVRALSAIDP